ncbi:hypothetical protein [Pseudomonas anguilliseptica]|uniref:hypothetical protein n=1 Tax=Pseudomonas anguilliseptica TaxID=53406 RepID=UPI001F373C8C|nr:hypothetical protein [Pseudomonas anguilliseptica]MCE5362517.1 hypothetical protein [Pseudomonas anguilliseptica]
MAEQRKRPRVTVNLAAIELAYAPSNADMLEHGTTQEVREALLSLGDLIAMGRGQDLGPRTIAVLGEALRKIGCGEDANKALGLNRKKKYGVWYSKQLDWLIKDLMRQGMTRQEAEDFMGRLDLKKLAAAKETFSLDDIEAADEKLRKRLVRAKTK